MDGIAYYQNCFGTFDHIVKIQDCVNKINIGSGEEPTTIWQELAIESTDAQEYGERAAQEGAGRT